MEFSPGDVFGDIVDFRVIFVSYIGEFEVKLLAVEANSVAHFLILYQVFVN